MIWKEIVRLFQWKVMLLWQDLKRKLARSKEQRRRCREGDVALNLASICSVGGDAAWLLCRRQNFRTGACEGHGCGEGGDTDVAGLSKSLPPH